MLNTIVTAVITIGSPTNSVRLFHIYFFVHGQYRVNNTFKEVTINVVSTLLIIKVWSDLIGKHFH